MKLELKSLTTSDADLSQFDPSAEEPIRLYFEAEIGIAGEEGGDIFGFNACNAKWLSGQHAEFDSLRGYFLVSSFEPGAIQASLSKFLSNTDGNSWEELCSKVARHMFWEFEDYIE